MKTYRDLFPLPVHLITGLLGSGKTTALTHLLSQKPPEENWGFIINEFGNIDIDAATLSQANSNRQVLSIAGGCVCCTAQHGLKQAINQILKQQQPNQALTRLWIEPTGLGHPAKIIDTLTRETFIQAIELQKVVCVITPHQLTPERWQKSAVMRDLVTLSDIILLNKTDLSQSEETQQAQQLLSHLYPPKLEIYPTRHSQIALSDVTQTRQAPTLTIFNSPVPKNSAQDRAEHFQSANLSSQTLRSSLPSVLNCIKQSDSNSNIPYSIGWVFNTDIQFNRIKLQAFFTTLSPLLRRAKGILKTGNEWQLINWTNTHGECQLTIEEIAWRQDSRLECLFTESDSLTQQTALKTLDNLEEHLQNCLVIRNK